MSDELVMFGEALDALVPALGQAVRDEGAKAGAIAREAGQPPPEPEPVRVCGGAAVCEDCGFPR